VHGGSRSGWPLAVAVIATAAVAWWGAAGAVADHAPRRPMIVNGQPAPPGAFPFMAALVEPDLPAEDGQFCGGALIAPKIVLTAAHCIEGSSPRELQVVVGRSTLSDRNGQRIRVAKIAEDPRANINRALPVSDAAQVRLKDKATVTPLDIVGPEDASLYAGGQPARAIGWGVIGERSVESPDQLYEADIAFVAESGCRKAYGLAFDARTTLCATAPGVDTCYGDSGSPLLVANPAGGWLEAGIVSSGFGCARPKYPGTYAKVAALRGFILDRQPIFAPYDKDRPFLSGRPSAGGRLHCHRGSWHGDVRRFVYRWVLVRGGEATRTVANGQRWRVRERLQGRDVACEVFGMNGGGFSSARSHAARIERPRR
jgi:trypsin